VRCMARCFGFALLTFVTALAAFAIVVRTIAPKIEPRYCGDAFALIELGMSQQDVEAVFGEPEGDYNTGPFEGPSCGVGLPFKGYAGEQVVTGLIWTYDDKEIVVGLDAQGKVASVGSAPNLYGTGRPPSFLEKIQWLLK